MRMRFTVLVGFTATAVGCLVVGGAVRADLFVSGFEGDMSSVFTAIEDEVEIDVDWFTDTGITTPATFISTSDVDYVGGVTEGTQALKLTYPWEWGSATDPYLRLHGQEQLMQAAIDHKVLAFDVTTLGLPEDPEAGPGYRQVFPIFNMSVPGQGDIFYDANFDVDVQREITVAELEQDFFTQTVMLRLDAALGVVEPDDAIPMNIIAQNIKNVHDVTPIENFHFQMVWVFQGDDTPFSEQISVIIDNVRFLTEVPVPGLSGDYNENDTIDAADYTVWRDIMTAGGTVLANDPTPGIVDETDFDYWRDHFGEVLGAGAGAGALGNAVVPEPSSLLLALSTLGALIALRRTSH